MKKAFSINYKILCIVLLCLLAAAAVLGFVFFRPGYQPAFTVTGDVSNVLKIKSMDGYNVYTAQSDGAGYSSLKLSELVERAAPFSSDNTVVIRGDDGLIAQVDGGRLDGMYVTFTSQYGWEMINEFHPPSSNIKRIKDIWVVSDTALPDKSVSVISQDENIASFTPGQLFMSETLFSPVFQGTSENEAEGGGYSVSVYTEKRYKNVADIAPDAGGILVAGEGGAYGYDTAPGRITLAGNTLQYVYSDGRTTMDNVRGILINPPSASNMDAYHEAANSLSANKRALVILTDGFGYHQYVFATQNGYAPYLASRKPATIAASAYRPVTNTGTAMILTGQPPSVNGVYDHHMSELKSPDIFEYAAKLNKTAACIEGDVKILNTSIAPKLNADRNGNGTDDEIFEAAKQALADGTDYVFAHFHGIDDAGHTYGDLSENTMESIRAVDSYIAVLAEGFHGTIIIVSDHGMHAAADGGGHGEFRHEDMIIPYISFYQD